MTPTVSNSAIATTSTGITATHTDDRESTASTDSSHSTPVVFSVSRASTAVSESSSGPEVISFATKTSVRLPKLTLRSFSGDLTQWFTFWDSFSVDKFNYLKSLLSGTALEAIQGLTLTDANYNEAVTILQKRFGNRQQIIDKHMDNSRKMSTMGSEFQSGFRVCSNTSF